MEEIIFQLKCIKEHLDFISKNEDKSVNFDVQVLDTCISQLEEKNNKPSVNEIVSKLEKASWKSYSDVARRNLLWLDDAIKIVKGDK